MNFAFEKKFKIYYNDWKYIIFREDNNTRDYLLSIDDIKTLPYNSFKKTFNNPYIHMNYVDDNLSFIDKL